MSKKFVLNEMRKIQDVLDKNSSDYTSHLVIGIDQDENGFPESTMTMSSAKPLELIGMCEQLIEMLKDIKKGAMNRMKPRKKGVFKDQDLEAMTNALPKSVRDRIHDFKKRMDAAVESGDPEEMAKVRDELLKMKNPFNDLNNALNNDSDDSDKTDDFNINDFK
jgi:hypothetical protein